jgi:hypothetical protein
MSSSAKAFETVVRGILIANGFRLPPATQGGGKDVGFDWSGSRHSESWAIEAKYYRTARAQASLLETAAGRVSAAGIAAKMQKAMLVVSCQVAPDLKVALELKYGISVVDRDALVNLAAKRPLLLDSLNAVLEADPSLPLTATARVETEPPGRESPTLPEKAGRVDTRGSSLCAELHKLTPGPQKWKAYEKLCVKILRYLFPNDLLGWREQQRTDDGLNAFDLVCRIRPTTDFWTFLLQHLDSRYVLFEFKNYTDEIKQGQILTTEKYLLERGLRRVAIILVRQGADENAVTMTKGAMREHGKLMLVANDEIVCKMLHMKERGEDPTDCLFELADDFLLTLSR